MENTTLIGRNKGDKGNRRNGSREIRVVTKESRPTEESDGSHKLRQLVAISPVIQPRPRANTIASSNFCDGLTGSSFRFPPRWLPRCRVLIL